MNGVPDSYYLRLREPPRSVPMIWIYLPMGTTKCKCGACCWKRVASFEPNVYLCESCSKTKEFKP